MSTTSHLFVYAAIFFAAAVEGEIIYTSAVVLAYLGYLNALGVLIAGAAGGSAGDQFFYYLMRGKLSNQLDRFPAICRRRDAIVHRVRQHATSMILLSRFLPGLRIAIPAACAYAGVGAVRFSSLSLISGAAWATGIMAVITWFGVTSLSRFGLQGWRAALIPAALVVLFFKWLSRSTQV